ncbi:hypothetical protein VPH35_088934 [Triticum aestivum]
MADAQPNSGGMAVNPPGMVKKKKAKAPRKPRSECMPEEIAKLDAESAKRRNRTAVVKDNATAAKFTAERDAMEVVRRKDKVEEKEAIVNKAHALNMLGICRPAGFSVVAVGPASTGSSVARPPNCQSPTSRTTPMSPSFPPPRHDGHTHFLGSPDVAVIAPSTPRPTAVIDLKVTPGSRSGGRPSVEMQRKQAQPPFMGTMPSPHVLFDGMPTPTPPVDNPFYNQSTLLMECQHRRHWSTMVGMALPTILRRPKVRMAMPSTLLMKRPTTMLTTTMVTRGMKTMTSIAKDQYHELQRKRGKKSAKFAGGGDGEALKRPRGKTISMVDDIRDASSMALHETLHGMMSQKDVRDEKKRQSKDKQIKQYLELERKKLEMEEAAKKRKIDMEEASRQRQLDIEAANVKARHRQLDIEATNAATKVKEVALAIMSVDLTKMSEKTRSWF